MVARVLPELCVSKLDPKWISKDLDHVSRKNLKYNIFGSCIKVERTQNIIYLDYVSRKNLKYQISKLN